MQIKESDPELGPVCGNPPAWSEVWGLVFISDKANTDVGHRNVQISAMPSRGFVPPKGASITSTVFAGAFSWILTVVNAHILTTRLLSLECEYHHPAQKVSSDMFSGGGCTKDKDGNLTLIRDQDFKNVTVKSLLNNQQSKLPVGLVIGKPGVSHPCPTLLTTFAGSKNKELKRKLPHRYNVMAYFQVTDVWYERVGEKTGVKVRFEKLELSEKSWWAALGSPNPPSLEERDFDTKPESIQCLSCHRKSPRIYNEGWMCLEPTCTDFWYINQSRPDALTFHPDFLNTRSRPARTIRPHHSLIPNLLGTISEDDPEVSSMRIAWKAIVCPLCSKCVPRMFWRGWKCTDDGITGPQHQCPFQKLFNMPPVSIRSVVDDFDLGPIQRALYFNPKMAIPEIDDESLFPYRKLTYRIRGVGSITHFVANRAINSQYGGPNDMFRTLQTGDLGLRRYRLQQSVGKHIRLRAFTRELTAHTVAGTLTAHFAVNFVSTQPEMCSLQQNNSE